MRRWAPLLVAALLSAAGPAAAGCRPWPAWEAFRNQFVSGDGRVIDHATSRNQTTSEGQAYALFFALVGNDRPGFAKLLRWTEDNLAGGDLAAHLPAWQWGRRDDGSWGVVDDNAAADADLWLAYTLAEAGRLWRVPRYSALARKLAANIVEKESADLPDLGRTLLPGPRGFHTTPGVWRLNPSYVPIQLLRRLAHLYPDSAWDGLVSTAIELTVRASPRGFAPDWVVYNADDGFQPDARTHAVGSYDAIRVYLWAGMLAKGDPARAVVLQVLAPMAREVAARGAPPLKVDTRAGTVQGEGPSGFSAALLPFLSTSGARAAAQRQGARLAAADADAQDNYYDQVLTLFGRGWSHHHFRFARDGSLVPDWKCAAHSSPSH